VLSLLTRKLHYNQVKKSENIVQSRYHQETTLQSSENIVQSHYHQETTLQSSEKSEKIVQSRYHQETTLQSSENSVPNTPPNKKEGLEKNNQNTFISPYQYGIEEEETSNTQSQISKWDEQFMELRNNKLSSEETPIQLQDNFVAAATTYSKMIIAERHIETKDKKNETNGCWRFSRWHKVFNT